MQIDRGDDDERPFHGRADFAEFISNRAPNPNTADGELQNMAAFSAGFSQLTGPRRTVAVVVVWLILIGFAIGIGYGIVGIVRIW